jgi:hypothetical protein
MENTKALVLTADTLELKIGKKELGALTTNALEIKAKVVEILPKYDVDNYNESNIDSAKKDKALLNSSAKALNDKRIEIEKEWMVPFTEFKDIVSETCKLIKSVTDKIDTVVKDSEAKAKAEKKTEISTYWEGKKFTLVSLDKIFDEKWLNKTSKIKDIKIEIDGAINKINDDIKTLEAIGADVETLKAMYLENLDINKTIQYANTLKQNKEKLTSYGSTPAVKEVPAVDENPFSEEVAHVPAVKEVPASTEPKTELLVRSMKVTATYDQLVALGNFMNDNNITFEKIENE